MALVRALRAAFSGEPPFSSHDELWYYSCIMKVREKHMHAVICTL